MATKKQKIDWRKELSVDCSKMTRRDARRLQDKADNWFTNPVAHKVIECDSWGMPEDNKAGKLGEKFTYAIDEIYAAVANYNDDRKFKHLYVADANKARLKAIAILDKIELHIGTIIQKRIKELQELGYKLVKK